MIIDLLEENRDRIIEKLVSDNWRFFRDYFFIKENFDAGNLDDEFRRTFCHFYRLNGPRGLNDLQKEKFFELLSSREVNFERIIEELYQIPGYGGGNKIFLSFATKLIHTIDNFSPIYDGNVASILELIPQVHGVLHEDQVENRRRIYQDLKNKFGISLADQRYKSYLENLREELRRRAEIESFHWRDELILEVKLLDSALWALYSIIE